MPIALDIPAAETAIIETTNAFRAEHKLAAVSVSPPLAAAARAYAKVLAARQGEMSHTADGTTPVERAKTAGYASCQIAENIAALFDRQGFTATEYAQRTLAGWEASHGHRENLLRPQLTEIGVGVARIGANDPRYVAVQLFGRPLALKYSIRIVNKAGADIPYAFAGEARMIKPRQIITHTSCAPDALIAFAIGRERAAAGRYAARNGQVYTLTPDGSGGVKVAVSP